MASIEEALSALCTTRTDLVAAFGGRCYDTILPQSGGDLARDFPALTWQVTARRDEPHFAGTGKVHAVDIQTDIWARTPADRRRLSALWATAMREWAGSWGGLTISRAFKSSDTDGYASVEDAGPYPVFRSTTAWTVWLKEP